MMLTRPTLLRTCIRSSSSSSTRPAKFPIGPVLAAVVLPAGAYYYYYHTSIHPTAINALEPKAALNPNDFVAFKLKEVVPINHNTSRFRFALPDDATELGLPTASCLLTRFTRGTKADGSPDIVVRPYTPIEDPALGHSGTFDLVIKKYPNGPMSTHIHALQPGQALEMKGPIKKIEYKPNEYGLIGMIAGGTGITPMLQVIQRIAANPQDKTRVHLVFANIEEHDILVKEYLDDLVKRKPEQFNVYYVLQTPPKDWSQGIGYVNEAHVQQWMPAPGQGKVFVCGPNPMLQHISGTKAPDYTQGPLGGILKNMGYSEADVFKF